LTTSQIERHPCLNQRAGQNKDRVKRRSLKIIDYIAYKLSRSPTWVESVLSDSRYVTSGETIELALALNLNYRISLSINENSVVDGGDR
jgi:hypothetical protein